jgi:hypothetical protein
MRGDKARRKISNFKFQDPNPKTPETRNLKPETLQTLQTPQTQKPNPQPLHSNLPIQS